MRLATSVALIAVNLAACGRVGIGRDDAAADAIVMNETGMLDSGNETLPLADAAADTSDATGASETGFDSSSAIDAPSTVDVGDGTVAVDTGACAPAGSAMCSGSDAIRCESGRWITHVCFACTGAGVCVDYTAPYTNGRLAFDGSRGSIGNRAVTVMSSETWVFNTATGEIRLYTGVPDGGIADAGADAGVAATTIRAAGAGVASDIGYETIPNRGSTPIGVFSFARLTISDGAVVTAVGANPFALFLTESMEVNGVLSVSATDNPFLAGPGGGAGGAEASGLGQIGVNGSGVGGGRGGQPWAMPNQNCGGSGASNRGAGGSGGCDSVGMFTTAPPPVNPFTVGSDPLSGGAGGGSGSAADVLLGGTGGGGGGAVMVSARERIFISPSGRVRSNGGGARGPASTTLWDNNGASGGGGGAGGTILLNAPVIDVRGYMTVLGGGGSSTSVSYGAAGLHGETPFDLIAAGGAALPGEAGGGAGSNAAGVARAGDGSPRETNGGGGGGGHGHVVLCTRGPSSLDVVTDSILPDESVALTRCTLNP